MAARIKKIRHDENTVTAMINAYEMGFEHGSKAYAHLTDAVDVRWFFRHIHPLEPSLNNGVYCSASFCRFPARSLTILHHPSYTKHWERKEIATSFYTPKSKVWYAFIRGMERHEQFPVIAKGAKADIRGVLKKLTESSSRYIEDGSWIVALSKDIEDAKYIMEHNL